MLRSLLLSATCLCAVGHAQVSPTFPNLAYANLGGTDLRLDLYLPPTGPAPYPLVVWIHGGAWTTGSKSPIPPGVADLLQSGLAVASVDYRLTSQAGQYGSFPITFPAQIEDVKGAVRWLRANAGTYGIDSTRIGSWGASAGGHLSALLGASGGASQLEGVVGGNLGQSSSVQAVVDYFGPVDLFNMDPDVTTPPGSTVAYDPYFSPASHLIGFDQPGQGIGVLRQHQFDPNPPYPFFVRLVRYANPITWLDVSDPPFFIAHGTQDTVVPLHQSVRLADALRDAGVPYAYDQAVGGGHGFGGPHDVAVRHFFVQRFFGSQTVTSFCSADAASALCPCGNAGDFGHGCASSQAMGNGALLLAGGAQSSATMTLQALTMPQGSISVFLQGDAELGTPVNYGDGLRCIRGTLKRLAIRPIDDGAAMFPDPAAGDPSIQARSAALGAPIPAGATRSYQVYYRDNSSTFCPAPAGSTFNVTSAVRILWP